MSVELGRKAEERLVTRYKLRNALKFNLEVPKKIFQTANRGKYLLDSVMDMNSELLLKAFLCKIWC